MPLSPNELSEQLLYAVKLYKDSRALEGQLKALDFERLRQELHNDARKKAFWINIYNAFFQILRKRESKQKPEIYRERLFEIAGHPFSLDDVEHGVLRRFRYKYSLGYLANPFAAKRIKDLAVSKVDYRIHFALNCGAVSCPPIAFYSSEGLEEQLNTAALSFLETETKAYPERKEVHISTLFKWYLGDFGGLGGVREVLQKHLNMDSKGSKLVFTEYSWEEQLDNYIESTFNL